MTNRPILRMAPADLDRLMTTLEVSFVRLAECRVSPGWRLRLPAMSMPGIHYSLIGMGQAGVDEETPIGISPHTLFITPPGKTLWIEAAGGIGPADGRKLVEFDEFGPAELRQFVAGDAEPKIILICGYFRASVRRFDRPLRGFAFANRRDVQRARAPRWPIEIRARRAHRARGRQRRDDGRSDETGPGDHPAALTELNRALGRTISILGDPQIARAFADMVARPGASHSIQTLSQTSGLSRSAFMARFNETFGNSPMTVLRQLRMRRAATLVQADKLADRRDCACGRIYERKQFSPSLP